ncbi:MAG TPA: 4'-phosphopantetheinyl transferase superfamily protein [Deltaproteobacteria bacterium]|nr:4'-phosphopantetheinyl transferase superfamily protein [Deltaproteobacteria bacterium]
MEIVGIGMEMVDIGRFEAAMERRGRRLLERLFTAAEIEYGLSRRRPAAALSARFAAKAALRKALGRAVPFRHVEVGRDGLGRPVLVGACLEGVAASLSMSHDGGVSLASVIVGRTP